MEQTLDRKLKFLKYNYNRISYKMDETLFYLLQRIQEIDNGPDPLAFVNGLKMTSLVDEDESKVLDPTMGKRVKIQTQKEEELNNENNNSNSHNNGPFSNPLGLIDPSMSGNGDGNPFNGQNWY